MQSHRKVWADPAAADLEPGHRPWRGLRRRDSRRQAPRLGRRGEEGCGLASRHRRRQHRLLLNIRGSDRPLPTPLPQPSPARGDGNARWFVDPAKLANGPDPRPTRRAPAIRGDRPALQSSGGRVRVCGRSGAERRGLRRISCARACQGGRGGDPITLAKAKKNATAIRGCLDATAGRCCDRAVLPGRRPALARSVDEGPPPPPGGARARPRPALPRPELRDHLGAHGPNAALPHTASPRRQPEADRRHALSRRFGGLGISGRHHRHHPEPSPSATRTPRCRGRFTCPEGATIALAEAVFTKHGRQPTRHAGPLFLWRAGSISTTARATASAAISASRSGAAALSPSAAATWHFEPARIISNEPGSYKPGRVRHPHRGSSGPGWIRPPRPRLAPRSSTQLIEVTHPHAGADRPPADRPAPPDRAREGAARHLPPRVMDELAPLLDEPTRALAEQATAPPL
jgi:hypothetical protein